MAVENPNKPDFPGANHGYVDVEVETQEVVGIVFIGILFFLVFLALLRSQRRERKLLREIAEIRSQGA
jgi:hypothetical protein